jgi:phage shock protein A
MALITRVARLFKADMHAVLDRIEEPETLPRQAVREMEEDLARDEQRLTLLDHEAGQLAARRRETERSLAGVDEQLDVCFGAGKDDLARSQIRRRLELQRLGEGLECRREALADARAALDARVEENRSRLDAMRQKAELLAGSSGAADVFEHTARADAQAPVTDDEVEVAFLREQQRRARS